jgi:hypothetical protein
LPPAAAVPNSPQAGTLCAYNDDGIQKIYNGFEYEVIDGAHFSCTGGAVEVVRFFGCIEHSPNGTTNWAADTDSCTPPWPTGDLYANGNAVSSGDWGYAHACVPNGGYWHYRLHFRITGYFANNLQPFDTGRPVAWEPLRKLLTVSSFQAGPSPASPWVDRYKTLVALVSSEHRSDIEEAVAQLEAREQSTGISVAEQRLLERATSRLRNRPV